jgi:hypothetical protein
VEEGGVGGGSRHATEAAARYLTAVEH